MAGLSAGRLDREIVLQIASLVQSDSGEATLDWDNATEETLWAEWLPAGTREAWQAQQRLNAYIEGVFRIYWRDDIVPERTRITWDGKVFDVKPPIEIGRQEGLDVPVVATP